MSSVSDHPSNGWERPKRALEALLDFLELSVARVLLGFSWSALGVLFRCSSWNLLGVLSGALGVLLEGFSVLLECSWHAFGVLFSCFWSALGKPLAYSV